jgi:hypothetical protein
MNIKYFVYMDLYSHSSINILGFRKQLCIATKAIMNNKNEVTFPVGSYWSNEV